MGRMGALWRLLGLFLIVNAAVRVGLAVFNGDASLFLPWRLLPALGIGVVFDTAAAVHGLGPLALLMALWPGQRWGGGRSLAWVIGACLLGCSVLLVFVGVSEFTFWNEFASRFNFIAVDYLIYTNEVVGNIRESYNLPLMLGGVAVASMLLWWLACRWVLPAVRSAAPALGARLAVAVVWMLMPALAYVAVDARYKEFSSNAQLDELAGNGYYDFWHAFWTNEIDYERFYATLPRQRAAAELALELSGHKPVTVTQRPFDREIVAVGPERRHNVVLVSIESLSASFLAAWGDRRGLTPHLDQLAREGLVFKQLYATGTRTVRGLEALTLSVPPTPGHSIVKRPDNAQMFTLGEVFRERGYEPLYLYGGYGYFDNMNAFFSGNGYTVIDRTALRPEDIHFENIWGVADEDLFTLVLRELDAREARKQPFFAHVMTTSNHRPFTYPEGRIDIPSKTGREGGVKYTDYAIGRFVEQARHKPWFANTVFVFVADHTHNGRGKQELPPDAYRIPCIVWAPGLVEPREVDTLASQIDVGPTLLGLLNVSYRSRFFGHDILRDGPSHQRALMANYQTVGYYEKGRIVELKPNGRVRVVDAASGRPAPADELSRHLTEEAISYYQMASEAYRLGELKR
ncbi:MAG: sulfatase-like hydrolase/transferase [Burkholderiales bacterium]|nr:sulfatase-like hydrolase/transferase [Burkholderiales bacterium]